MFCLLSPTMKHQLNCTQWRRQGGTCFPLPPFLNKMRQVFYQSVNLLICQKKYCLFLILYSESFVVDIDSDDFDKADYKTDIQSSQQYFHDDRINEACCCPLCINRERTRYASVACTAKQNCKTKPHFF